MKQRKDWTLGCVFILCLLLSTSTGEQKDAATVFFTRSLLQSDEQEIRRSRFPYVVSVRDDGQHVCTGALVHPNWVVVAAHCIRKGAELDALINPLTLADTENVVGIDKYEFCESTQDLNQDQSLVALLKLEKAAPDANVTSIPDPSFIPQGKDSVAGLGWNTKRGEVNGKMDAQLVGVVPNVNCEDAWNMRMQDSMFCVSARIDEECEGEEKSGILMIVNQLGDGVNEGRPEFDLLAGLLYQRQDECMEGNQPSIYINIARFRNCIETVTQEEDSPEASPPMEQGSESEIMSELSSTIVGFVQGNENTVVERNPDISHRPSSSPNP